jgi:subfamily B ATP-binding cassette protein MsbA
LKDLRTVRLLLPLLRPYAWGLPAVILLGILSTLAESIGLSLFVPLLQSLGQRHAEIDAPDRLENFFHMVLARVPEGDRLPYIATLILSLTIGKALLTFGHSIMVAGINARITHSLRSRIFAKALRITQEELDQTGCGRLINLLATDTWYAGDAISTFISLVINLCSIFVFTALLVALSWRLTVVVAAGVTLVSVFLQGVTKGAQRLGQQGVAENALLSNRMLDALEGIREIQMFSLTKYLAQRFEKISERVRSVYLRLDLLHRSISPLSEVAYIGLLIALLLVGVKTGNSAPTLIVFLLVLYRLQPQIRQLDGARLSLVALTTPVREVVSFLESNIEPRESQIDGVKLRFENHIDFKDVYFRYGADMVLHDINVQIPCGHTTAIVGPSGSGKTTLVSLLCRFYNATSGEIRVDGQPLSDVDVDAWRRDIAWVSQEAYMFGATIADNIRYGRLDATRDEVVMAAIQADADHFIRQLPNGYDTAIGNGGTRLSSGQMQRIALARAFVRKPRILILDEATNALDSISEETIRAALRGISGMRTVIIISHRLSTVRHADHVVVLSNGRVTDQGSPRELLARRGLLRTFQELQHVD